MYKFQAYINGKFVDAQSGRVVEILSPETNQVVGSVPALSKEELDAAFTLAKRAEATWSKKTRAYRCAILEKFANFLLENKEEIAQIMVAEIAKGHAASVAEVVLGANYIKKAVKYYLNEKIEVLTEVDHGVKGKKVILEWKPFGVITSISPFNFPVNLAVTKFIPALITGNTVIFKAATNGSLTGVMLAKGLHAAGIPAGVFNNVTGRGADIGDELIQNPNVCGISFTGSSPVGKRIATLVSKIPTVLELGGKSPAIVLKDANLDHAVNKIVAGAFGFSGQRCTAIKRVLVDKAVKDKLIAKLKDAIAKTPVGRASDDAVVTALINQPAVAFVEGLVTDAKNKGANFNGYVFRKENNLVYPMLISDVTKAMDIYYDEQFGPVLPIIDFATEAEAIAIANDSRYGLQASIFTTDIDRGQRLAWEIETGSVNINSFPQSGPIELPFTGVKDSGFMTQGLKYSINNMRRNFNIVINE